KCLVRQPSLDRLGSQLRVKILGGTIIAIDRQKLGFEISAEDARLAIARGTCHGPAAQSAVNVNGAASDDFGARPNRSEHGHVTIRMKDRLAGANRALHQE